MRIIAVLTIVTLIGALFAGLWFKSSPAERPWMPMLIVGLIALGLASCAVMKDVGRPGPFGEDAGDPGRP